MKTKIRVVTRSLFVPLALGLSIGFSLAYLMIISTRETERDYVKDPIRVIGALGADKSAHKDEDTSIADELSKKVRVLCWVMTDPDNHAARAAHVKATWGKRCNKLLFMSTEEDLSLPAIKLPVPEGTEYRWAKTKAAFRYIYEYHRREAEWFLKADDDTFVVLENLRYMLRNYDSSQPLYFGCRLNRYSPQGYMDGGAGYVLSKEALERFVNKAVYTPEHCYAGDDGSEDVQMGNCLKNVGVVAMDTRDEMNRGRFFPLVPQDHLLPYADENDWYWNYLYYPTEEGLDCCSDHAISFHLVPPDMMYALDYLIYHVHPYGIQHDISILPQILKKKNESE